MAIFNRKKLQFLALACFIGLQPMMMQAIDSTNLTSSWSMPTFMNTIFSNVQSFDRKCWSTIAAALGLAGLCFFGCKVFIKLKAKDIRRSLGSRLHAVADFTQSVDMDRERHNIGRLLALVINDEKTYNGF